MADPKLVVIESPYAGDIVKNEGYARRCLADAISRKEAPLASHLLYTQPGVLQETIPEQRELGMSYGRAWIRAADYVVVYCDLGVSKGMVRAIAYAMEIKKEVFFRYLD